MSRIGRSPEQSATEAHRRPDRFESVGGELLRDQSDLRSGAAIIAQDIAAIDDDVARRRGHNAADNTDKSRFAGAVRTEQGENFPLANCEVDRFQRLES